MFGQKAKSKQNKCKKTIGTNKINAKTIANAQVHLFPPFFFVSFLFFPLLTLLFCFCVFWIVLICFFFHFFARLFFSSLLISLNRQWSGEHNANGVLTIKHWLWWYYRDWIWLNYITTSRINLTTSLRRHLKNVFFWWGEASPSRIQISWGLKALKPWLGFFWGLRLTKQMGLSPPTNERNLADKNRGGHQTKYCEWSSVCEAGLCREAEKRCC